MQIRLGYPCINWSLNCRTNKKFRLSSLNEKKLIETVKNNLTCLKKTLEFNLEHHLLFFRISSDSIPFASHDKFEFNWQSYFKYEFERISKLIHEGGFRISAHPGQFVVLNSPNEEVVRKAIRELDYHAKLFEALNLGRDAKIQIHIGGVYGNKEGSLVRFVEHYERLPSNIKKHLVIENDDAYYSLADCLWIYERTGIPVVLDVFHHSINNNGEPLDDAIKLALKTWQNHDGVLMIDYSSQEPEKKIGTHCDHIDEEHFKDFVRTLLRLKTSCDIMLEITDKERSCLIARDILKNMLEKN